MLALTNRKIRHALGRISAAVTAAALMTVSGSLPVFAEEFQTGGAAAGIAAAGGETAGGAADFSTVLAPLIGTDQYLAIPVSGSQMSLYDETGRACGQLFRYIAENYQPFLLPKDMIIVEDTGSDTEVHLLGQTECIFSVPKEQFEVYPFDDFFVVFHKEGGSADIYDRNARMLGSLPPHPHATTIYARRLDSCTLISLFLDLSYKEDPVHQCPDVVRVSFDENGNGRVETLSNPVLSEAFQSSYTLSAAGDCLVLDQLFINDRALYEEYRQMSDVPLVSGRYALLDSYGNATGQYFDDVNIRNSDSEPFYPGGFSTLMQLRGDTWLLYNTALEPIGFRKAEDGGAVLNDAGGSYVYGAWYPELGGIYSGNITTSLVESFPYSRSGSHWQRNRSGVILSADLDASETLLDMSASFAAARPENGGYYSQRLYWRQTHENVLPDADSLHFNVRMGDDYCILRFEPIDEDVQADEDIPTGEEIPAGNDLPAGTAESPAGPAELDGHPLRGTIILDLAGHVRYQSDHAYIYPWKPGMVFMERGVYSGIADLDGNWLIRTSTMGE